MIGHDRDAAVMEAEVGVMPQPDVEAIVAAVLACAGVAGLDSDIVTYVGDRRVEGVGISGDVMQLHVHGWCDLSVEVLCAEICAAVAVVAPTMSVVISVPEIVDPYEFPDDAGNGTDLRATGGVRRLVPGSHR